MRYLTSAFCTRQGAMWRGILQRRSVTGMALLDMLAADEG